MKGNFQVRFLGERGPVTGLSYPANSGVLISRFDKLWAEEYAPLSRELRTPELLLAHVSVGYW